MMNSNFYSIISLILMTISFLNFCEVRSFDDVPKKYLKDKGVTSLLCNTCSLISSIVNDTLFDESLSFDHLIGFRLDSSGKKIRKKSGWLKLFLSLEDICDEWKDNYRTAKRRNGYLYLLTNKLVKQIDESWTARKLVLEKEAEERLFAKWEEQDKILEQSEQSEQTTDQSENSETCDPSEEECTGENNDEKKDINEEDGEQEEDETDEEEEEEEDEFLKAEKKYFLEKKPKLLKKKAKQHKMLDDMCYFLSEKFDEWLHEQQKIISKKMNDGEKISQYLDTLQFCLDTSICVKEMFDTKPALFRKKRMLNLPQRPKKPEENIIETDYDEETEEDTTEDETGDNIIIDDSEDNPLDSGMDDKITEKVMDDDTNKPEL